MALSGFYPSPPSTVAPATTHHVVLITAIVLFALWVLYALADLIRTRSPILLFCAIGGLVCALMETFWGVLGLLNYRDGNLMSWIQFNFRGDPLWSTLLYSLFAGGSAYLFYDLTRKGAPRKQYWMGMGVIIVSNLVIEIPLTALKLYDYYGPQPFQFYQGGFPLWWLFTNLGGIASGVLLALAVGRYGVRGTLLAVPLVPCAFGAWELWAGWPTFVTMTMGVSRAWTYLGAAITIALSVSTVAAIVNAVRPRTETIERSPVPHQDAAGTR
ncbi:hypothetical protein HFP15_29685 [Amycolatopsis sp. K13G38]|uniref:Carotenoid biosynthesis protein n=1 Tax=Amycolatopsis acididurans TaxID=2724524 RepID=A0ABX1JC44_9PSEU|nr:hypothetical protein [Amycolatopsis acididurans]NKQ57049.1 hypothetical protein [Amycolatopsis acididurans]